MSSVLGFHAASILKTQDFSWVFLVDWIMILCLTIYILFYVNQLIGWLVSQLLGWYLYHRHNVYFKVEAIQISFLGSRVSFKNLVYVGPNQAFRIVHGHLTWRYWLTARRRAAFLIETEAQKSRPCALTLSLKGVEWFIYNRSPAYDALHSEEPALEIVQNISRDLSRGEKRLMSIVPLHIEMSQHAIILGNDQTPNLLVLHSHNATGELDISKASNLLDRYMIRYKSRHENMTVKLEPNPDWAGSSLAEFLPQAKGRKPVKGMPRLVGRLVRKSKAQTLKEKPTWMGLDRYADEEERANPHQDGEYARVLTMYESEWTEIEFGFDAVGPNESDSKPEGDCSAPPEFYIDLITSEATITYGPWHDRQRNILQRQFTPQKCTDSKPPSPAVAGAARRYHSMKISFETVDQAILVVPTREESKDVADPDRQLNYGWLELRVGPGSAGMYEMPYFPQSNGYTTTYSLDLKRPELRSSVNHATLLVGSSHQLVCTQAVPLQWNGKQHWKINMETKDMDLYLLREHISLISDLLMDLADGSPVDYPFFCPTVYEWNWDITNWALYLNVNKHNVINNPTSLSENIFLVFRTTKSSINTRIPIDEISPEVRHINFALHTARLVMELSAPQWHTLHSFLDLPQLGIVDDFELSFDDYISMSRVQRAIDQRIMRIYGQNFTLLCYGFVVDYLMTIRENYFGQYYHFKTTEEFLRMVDQSQSENFSFSRQNDPDTDVTIYSVVSNCCFVFPANIYSAKDNLAIYYEELDVDCRFTNYYMDLQADFTPLTLRACKGISPDEVLSLAQNPPDNTGSYIGALNIHGHRMFGLPPDEPTYLCKWDFDVGEICLSGLSIVLMMPRIVECFGHSYKDEENKPVVLLPQLHDLTFVSARVKSLKLLLDGVNVNLSNIRFRLHDLASERYTGRIYFESDVRLSARREDGTKAGEISFPLCISNFTTVPDPTEKYQLQQAHIALHDSLFHRCPFFLSDEFRNSQIYRSSKHSSKNLRPNLPLPTHPPQLTPEVFSIFHPNLADFDLNSRHSSRSSSVRSRFEPSESSSEHASSEDSYQEPKMQTGNASLFDLDPEQWYGGAPMLTGNDTYVNEDFVIQFGEIDGQVSIGIETVVQGIICKWPSESLESLLDDIQVKLVKDLRPKSSPVSLRGHLVVPMLRLRLTETWNSPEFVSVIARDIDLVAQSIEDQLRGLHLDIRGVRTSLVENERHNFAAAISLSNISTWLNDEEDERCGSFNCDDFDFMVSGQKTEWALDFVNRLAIEINEAWSGISLPNISSDPLGSAFLLLAQAGEENSIEEDPSVLSRPSGAIQSSDHVRSNVSWRVMMRERHLLQALNSSVVSEIRTQVKKGTFELPKDSRELAVRVFKRWRSWEHEINLDFASIFDLVYPHVVKIPARAEAFLFSFQNMSLRLILEQTEHFARTDDLCLELSTRREADASASNLLICCAQITTEIGHEVLPFLNVVANADVWKHIPKDSQSSSRTGQPGTRPPDALQISATIMMFDVSCFFKLPTLSVEYQLSKVQSTITSEYMHTGDFRTNFYSAVLTSATSGFRIYKPSEEVADCLIKSLAIGVAVKSRNTPWVTISSDNMSFQVHLAALRVAEVIDDFMNTDLSLIQSSLGQFISQDTPVESTKNKSDSPSGIGFSLNVRTLRLRTLLLDNFEILLQGQGLALRALTPFKILSVELDKGTLTMYYEKVLVAGTHLDNMRILARAREDLGECFASVYRIRMETASLMWLMSFLQQPELKKQLLAVQECGKDVFKNNRTTRDPSDSNPLRAQFFVNTIQLHLPIGLRTVVFSFDDIDLHHAAKAATSSGVSLNLSVLLAFTGSTQPSRQLLNLQLAATLGRGPYDDMIDIRSERCELAFDPETIGALNMALHKLKEFHPTGSGDRKDSIKSINWEEFDRLKAAVELQNISFTWYTNNNSTEGAQVGIERMSLTRSSVVMRLELTGIYMTPVAHDSSIPLNKRANTAYLPQLDVSGAFLRETKFLNLTMRGQRLNIDLTAAVAPWFASIIRSIDVAREIIARLGPSTPGTTPVEKPEPPSDGNERRAFRHQLPFNLHANISFAGAKFRLFDDANEVHEKEHPALELRTPSVTFTSDFLRQKGSCDRIFLDITVSSTSNTIFPKAIQECRSMYDSIRLILDRDSFRQQEEKTRQSEAVAGSLLGLTDGSSAIHGGNYNFLDSAEICVKLNFGSQEIYLSCVPFAKVGTLIAFQPSELLITGGEGTLTVQAILKGAQISLQHVYSREISWQARFDQVSGAAFKADGKPFRVLANIHSPQLKININQLHDLYMFLDIWRFFDPAGQKPEGADSGDSDSEEWFFKPASKTPASQSWTVNISATNVDSHVIFGQSIGEARVTVGRVWAAGFRSPDKEKQLNFGMKALKVESEGRLGGSLKVGGSSMRFTMLSTEERHLVQITTWMNSLECYLCLDFHPFLAVNVGNVQIGLINQNISSDKILVALNLEHIQIVATALVASHLLDVMRLFRRLHGHVTTSSTFYSPEARRMRDEVKNSEAENSPKISEAELHVDFDVKIGEILVHVFPAEFMDTMALKIHGRGMSLHFSQEPFRNGILNSAIDVHMIFLTIGLSQIHTNYTATITSLDTSEFLAFVRRSSPAGTVLLMPMLHLEMETGEGEREVHFVFSNEFGGSVEVGWNLGSINFIKEIARAHQSSWKSRHVLNASSLSPIDLRSKGTLATAPEKTYIADKELEVIIPQLRDLGEATPPIEWLGVNRERLPRLMHIYVIRSLNDICNEAKLLYTQILS